jgi:Sua5/YciO/YrdC/YwlC family protein
MDTKIVSRKDLNILVKALKEKKVIAFPTETVYGLGVVYDSLTAITALKKAKQRPENKPFTLMVSDKKVIHEFAEINQRDQCLIDAFMPGAITFIFNKKVNLADYITNGFSTIGIRYPNDPFVVRLIKEVNKPLLVPSANISGMPPAFNHKEVIEQFDGEIEYVVEGECVSEVASTIIDLTTDEIKLIRQGEITMEQIRRVLNESGIG